MIQEKKKYYLALVVYITVDKLCLGNSSFQIQPQNIEKSEAHQLFICI